MSSAPREHRGQETVEEEKTKRYAAGDRFGQYEIRAHIENGGMAEVYEAEHLALRKRVALKVLSERCAKSPQLRRRFVHEGQRAARIRHPNVVDITDVGTIDDTPFLVMEYLEGETLGERLDREGVLPVQEAIHLLVPVIAAAWAAHKQGVIHRDLKPENIYLARDGALRIRPKVLDFGVARIVDDVDERLTMPNAVLGTPFYMSPEQAQGDACDGRSDQFTLAVVLYEAITGQLPREGETLLKALNQAASGSIIPPSRFLPNIDSYLERVLLKALDPDPERRFDTARSFALALLDLASERAREFWFQELSDDQVDSVPTYEDQPSISGKRTRTSIPEVTLADATNPPPATQIPPAAGPSTTLVVSGTPPTGRSKATMVVLALVAVIALGIGVWWSQQAPETADGTVDASVAMYDVHLVVVPVGASIELDGEVVGHGTHSLALPKDGKEHRVVYRAEGFEPRTITFRDVAPPKKAIELVRLASTASASAPAPEQTVPKARPIPARAPVVASPPPPPVSPQPASAPRPQPAKPPSWKTDEDNKNPWATKK